VALGPTPLHKLSRSLPLVASVARQLVVYCEYNPVSTGYDTSDLRSIIAGAHKIHSNNPSNNKHKNPHFPCSETKGQPPGLSNRCSKVLRPQMSCLA
jgi:hypothetical protein